MCNKHFNLFTCACIKQLILTKLLKPIFFFKFDLFVGGGVQMGKKQASRIL